MLHIVHTTLYMLTNTALLHCTYVSSNTVTNLIVGVAVINCKRNTECKFEIYVYMEVCMSPLSVVWAPFHIK